MILLGLAALGLVAELAWSNRSSIYLWAFAEKVEFNDFYRFGKTKRVITRPQNVNKACAEIVRFQETVNPAQLTNELQEPEDGSVYMFNPTRRVHIYGRGQYELLSILDLLSDDGSSIIAWDHRRFKITEKQRDALIDSLVPLADPSNDEH